MGIQSLHSHTLLSDGKFTHPEVLKLAEKYKIEVIAFTDHDFVPDEAILNELKGYTGPVKWLIGIEMSSGLPKELGMSADGPHIIGLFTDPTDKNLREYCLKSQQEREVRMQTIVKNFQNLGFDITEVDCRNFTTGASIGQPHIVEALKSKDKNLKLIEIYKEKFRVASENYPNLKANYNYMIQRGERQEPYVLFMNKDAFLPVKPETGYWKDLDQSVKLIRDAGGVATIAHYSFSRKEIPLEIIEKLLKEDRLDGMEIIFGIDMGKTDLGHVFETDKQAIKQYLKSYNKLASGGADAHKEEDYLNYSENKNFSAESIGLIEKIIEKVKPNLKYSNF